MSTQRKKRRMHICLGLWRQKGMDVCAGWAARMGEWISCSCREFAGVKAKAKIGKAKAGLFHSPDALFHHTHTHTGQYSSLSRRRIRNRHVRYDLLVRLMHCCCFCWISGRRNGRRLCLALAMCCVCVCGDRRSCSVRSFLTRSSSQTGSLGRFESRRVSRITCVMKGWLWWC
jgi:hypothetical protein